MSKHENTVAKIESSDSDLPSWNIHTNHQERGLCNVDNKKKRDSLQLMNFSLDEISLAINKLGEDAPLNDLIDFIFAARIAENQSEDKDESKRANEERNEEQNAESSSGTKGKILRLLEMGFLKSQIYAAIEKYGSEIPLPELADSMFAEEIVGTCSKIDKCRGIEPGKHNGKRPKEEINDDFDTSKRPRGYLTSSGAEPKKGNLKITYPRELQPAARTNYRLDAPEARKTKSSKSVHEVVGRPPYFFYGSVVDLSPECWRNLSSFLYEIEPEMADTGFFSPLSKKEGYVHNLPSQNRSYILPRPPRTIQESMPGRRKWWPSWDTRKQLGCIDSETDGIREFCERMRKLLTESKGMVSVEHQTKILRECKSFNLVWVGEHKLAPLDPEHLEKIMGYPLHHTRIAGFGLEERLDALKHCFQTDTLAYHLSVLKSLFPKGLSVLSIYSGFGGAEIALHRLGIRMKAVVSVEICQRKQLVMKKWWQNTEQTGQLVQIDQIQKLSTNKLEDLSRKFGGFDIIICQNPKTHSSSSKGRAKVAAKDDGSREIDFMQFYEFVRVLQHVRNLR